MLIGLAVQPASTAEWIRLALSSIPDVEIIDVPGSFLFQKKIDLLIFDDEKPGAGFVIFYQELLKQQTSVDKIILGSPQSNLMMTIEWNPEDSLFLARPYQYEMIRQAANLKVEKLKNKFSGGIPSEMIPDPPLPSVPEPKKIKLGYLSTLHLADLIQMLCMSNWSGKIEITNLTNEEIGWVYINVGVLIHAKTSNKSGESACVEMLHWGRCSYDFSEEVTHIIQTIQSSYQSILLSGAKALDEHNHLKDFGT